MFVATVETTPFVALRSPVRVPIPSEVVVAFLKSAFTKCEVEEAKTPFCAQKGEVVAAATTP